MLGLVGQMGRAVLHLGDARIGIALGNPIFVEELLALALALQTLKPRVALLLLSSPTAS
jgi:hypothetical protein